MAYKDDEQYWEERDELVHEAVRQVAFITAKSLEKIPYRTSPLTGNAYLTELLTGNPRRVSEVLGMSAATFNKLCEWIHNYTLLRGTRGMSLNEKVTMFVWTLIHGASNREVQERWTHSGDTVSQYFHEVLEAFVILHSHIIKLPHEKQEPHPYIRGKGRSDKF